MCVGRRGKKYLERGVSSPSPSAVEFQYVFRVRVAIVVVIERRKEILMGFGAWLVVRLVGLG